MKKIKEILKDIWRNFGLALVTGIIFFALISFHILEMPLHWYFISIAIVSGGGVACIIYGLYKYFKK